MAGYDEQSGHLVYERPTRLIVNPARDQTLVELTQRVEAPRWDTDGAGALCGSGVGVSLVVTAEHDLFVRRERGSPFAKVRAGALAAQGGAFSMLACARAGVRQEHDVLLQLPFVEALGLQTQCQAEAFLELYGCWLRFGVLEGDDNAVRFGAGVCSTDFDVLWILKVSSRDHIVSYRVCRLCMSGFVSCIVLCCVYVIVRQRNPCWLCVCVCVRVCVCVCVSVSACLFVACMRVRVQPRNVAHLTLHKAL